MTAQERREKIVEILTKSAVPVAGTVLANELNVSRQIIVQDIALLRANKVEIIATNQGYIIQPGKRVSRVFKMIHTDEQVEEELSLIVDFGGIVQDVFVYHKVYGIVRADMNIRSRLDVYNYIGNIKSGKSNLLKNVTSGYHYHTVYAESEQILDMIQQVLTEKGFLAKLQDYEPVNFWENKDEN
ncbi:MAG: transcription repressor NadR [Faecalibacterium sp.]|nr:transcription repressor NadR [Ruminococcus sp.]MCM1392504.1 transcription repressor NadR [Ruminococcus sp.]MCM1486488.1 transcription repressor NadR [Faecalibacterium sp.]